IEDHYFLRSDDRVLQFNTLSFDPSIEEIMPTLLVGACLVIPAERIASAVEFRRTLRDQAITVAMPPPSYLQEALDAWNDEEPPIESVRLVATGGEVVRPELIPLCTRRLPRATVINVYGPTEATISSVNHAILPGAMPRPGPQIPIGRAHRGRAAY